MRRDLPQATATISPFTGGAELVRNPRGALTPPAPGAGSAAIVSGFLETHAPLYGLAAADLATIRFLGESVNRSNGLRMLRAEQAIDGIPVFQSDTRFILDRDGRLIRTTGRLVSRAGAAGADLASAIPASAALVSAMESVGIAVSPNDVSPGAQNGRSELRVANAHVTDGVSSRLVYFPLAPGALVLAYEQVTYTDGSGDYLTVVDATTGTLLWRKNIRDNQAPTQQARFSVYVQPDGVTPADSPAPQSPTTPAPGSGTQAPAIARTIVNMLSAQDFTASPSGWIPDGGTTTTGNNVDACLDRISGSSETNVCDIGALDDNGRPIGNPDAAGNNRDFLGTGPRDFGYTPAPAGSADAGDDPTGAGAAQDAFRRGAATQLFYVTNWYHDRLFHLGFDEAAGNFQAVNFGGLGGGGDAVRADVQNVGTNNANFSTPPDGRAPRMQMYRFTGPRPDRDSSLDADIVIHELTHGLSNRLVGDATGLFWDVATGMGEGWSDFYALSLLNNSQGDDPNASYAMGGYSTYRLGGLLDNYTYGIRRFPYSTDNAVNPLTWADVDDVTANYSGGIPISPLGIEGAGAFQVHNIGEIWALTLWEVRSRVIADPAGANGNVPVGNQTMLQLVTDALKLTPIDPSFVDARDALIDADCATNACANERWIWEGFADRGLGYGAVAPLGIFGVDSFVIGHMSIGPSADLPRLDVAGVAIDDNIGNGNGAIDPGETVRLTLQLRNPWRGTSMSVSSATAILTSSTPGVAILDGSSTYPAIPAGGTASGDTFLLNAGPGLACGQSIALTLQVTSALGTTSTTFTRRVGLASGTGAPVTFTRSHTPGLAIYDNDTAVSGLAVGDDFEIADLDFRVDDLQHTFVGDLTVLLRAPNGYGADLIFLPGLFADGGSGNNFVDTVIDDSATDSLWDATNDLAPFTGRWIPTFNEFDPIGQLSRLNGLSTRGDWAVLVGDSVGGDEGSLNGWSIIVTPRAFTCATVTGTTPLTLTIDAPTSDAVLTASAHFLPLAGTVSPGVTAVSWNSDRGGSGSAGATATDWMIPDVPLQPGVNVITVWATDATGRVGHDTLTVTFDRVTQHLAEGSTGSFFSMDLALANPNATAVRMALTFLKQDGSSLVQNLTLAPTSRTTIPLGDIQGLGQGSVSASLSSLDMLPIGVERTMFWDATGYGGHGEAGVGQPRLTWLFAEGSQGFFHTYLLLLNPNAEAATATLTFLPEGQAAVARTYELAPMSRLIVDAGEVPELLDRSFGTTIAATRPILAERAMSFGTSPGRLFAGGHASRGAPDPSPTWLFAEGATGRYLRHLRIAGQSGCCSRHGDLAVPAGERGDHHAATDRPAERPADGERRGVGRAAGQYRVCDRGHLGCADRGGAIDVLVGRWGRLDRRPQHGRGPGRRPEVAARRGPQRWRARVPDVHPAGEPGGDCRQRHHHLSRGERDDRGPEPRGAAGEPLQRARRWRCARAGWPVVRRPRRGDQRRRHRRREVDVLERGRCRLGRRHERRGDTHPVTANVHSSEFPRSSLGTPRRTER